MSYVVWEGETITMIKGTISIWFRVPKESMPASNESTKGFYYDVMPHIIPIVIFSRQMTGPYVDFEQPVINTFYRATNPLPPFNYQPFPYYGNILTPKNSKMSPSYIGVYIKDDEPLLVAHLQTNDFGQGLNTQQDLVGAEGVVGESGDQAGKLFGPTALRWRNSSSLDRRKEFFPPAMNRINNSKRELAFDEWHHVLLSWDLGRRNASHGRVDLDPAPLKDFVDAKSALYCALDDENLIDNDRPCEYWFNNMDDNDLFCEGCFGLAGNPYHTETGNPLEAPYWGFPTYSVAFNNGVEMDTVAVPSKPLLERTEYRGSNVPLEPIRKIEVAELQIFADLTLDTSVESNRRAFIDFIDAGKNFLRPVDPKKTEELLGVRPHILLHTQSNWQQGRNTGSIGLKRNPPPAEGNEIIEDEIIEAGQFEPNGIINKWMPDPVLHADEEE